MIICPEKKIIFIKNRKVAGTSVEIWMSQFCGPRSVITKIEQEDEEIRREKGYRGPQNYKIPVNRYTLEDLAKWILKGSTPPNFRNHDPALKAKKYYPKAYKSCFVFCTERNPFEKAISLYYYYLHRKGLKKSDMSFRAFLKVEGEKISNWDNYTNQNGEIIVDKIITLENLKKGMLQVCNVLGEKNEKIRDMPRAKSGVSPKKRMGIEDMEKESIQIIEDVCRREIDYFEFW